MNAQVDRAELWRTADALRGSLFSEIAPECLTRPGMDRHTKRELVSHSQHEKKHPHLMGHLRPHSRRLVASEMKRPLAGVTH